MEELSPRRARIISRLSSPRPPLQRREGSPYEEPLREKEDARTPTRRAPLYWCGLPCVLAPPPGYSSDDASHEREISVLLVVEVDHADHIVMIARLSRPSEPKVHYTEARKSYGVVTKGFAGDLVTHGFVIGVSKDDLSKLVPLFIMEC